MMVLSVREAVVLYVNISSKQVSEINRYSRSCRTDQPFHEELIINDGKLLSYYAGLIASDGCLLGGEQIALEMKASDRAVVDKFASTVVVKPVVRICTRKDRPNSCDTVKFVAKLPNFYKWLTSIRVVRNKSLILDVDWDTIPYRMHFVRGIIDGDGCVTIGKRLCDSSIRIATSSYNFADKLATNLRASVIVRSGSGSRKPSYLVQIKGSGCKSFCRILPSEDYMMVRKTDAILQISNQHGRLNRLALSGPEG